MNDGFEEFFGDHYSVVERAVALAIGDRGRAEEVTQEAFARAYRNWQRVSTMDRPVAWLYVVALNTERKRWRREQNAPALDPDMSGEDHAGSVVATLVLREAIVRLPPRQRAAIVLRYLAELSISEVASAMGCADGTVKATIHQALKSLRVDVGGSDL